LTTHKHLPALDGIRGLAILIVFIFHFGGGAQSPNPILRTIGLLIQAGWSGVTLFFVLSGFLISGILWDSRFAPGWWRNFYMRRTLRIFPLYYGTLLLVFITAVAAGKGLFSLSRIWIFALYLQNIPLLNVKSENVGSPLWLFHFWSLAVEEQFYLLWPFLLMRMRNLGQARTLCLGIFFFSAIFRVAIWYALPQTAILGGFLFTRAGELAVGAYLAMCIRDKALWHRLQARAPIVLIVSLAAFLIVGVTGHSLVLGTPSIFLIGLPCITIFFAALLVCSLDDGVVSRLACLSWLRWLGGISYGFYIFHVLLISVFARIAQTLAPHSSRNTVLALTLFVGGILSALLAWLSFRFFESPFLKRRNRYRVLQNA
jgi:peptidoglycan/LPS O-acetylase OafA/YrhL